MMHRSASLLLAAQLQHDQRRWLDPHDEDDQALIAAIAAGDSNALEQLYDRYELGSISRGATHA